MASPFAEAIMASMTSSLDPTNGMVKDYAKSQTDKLNAELIVLKADTIAVLESRMQACKDGSNDGNVLAAYQRLLDQATATR